MLSEESSLVSRCLFLIVGTTLGRFADMYRIVTYSVCSLQQWRLCIFGIGNVFPLMFCVLLCVCEFFDDWVVILFNESKRIFSARCLIGVSWYSDRMCRYVCCVFVNILLYCSS